MKLLNNLSIKSKLVAIVITATLLSVVIGTTIFVLSNIQLFKDSLIRESLLIAEVTGDNCQGTLEFNYPDEAKEYLENLKNQKNIDYICLFDKQDNLFAEYWRGSNSEKFIPTLNNYQYKFEDNYLNVYSKIYRDNVYLGTIYLRVSTENLSNEITRYLLFVLIITATLILFSIIIALRLQTIISKPILRLADTARQISMMGDYSIRINIETNDEISVLYKGFNNMLDQIQKKSQERDNIEMALRESETRLQTITAISPVGIYRNNENGELIWGNQKTLELAGLSLVEAAGHGWENNIHPEDRIRFDQGWYSAINAQRNFSDEYRFRHGDGKVVWVFGQSVAEYDQDGTLQGFVGTMTDITERKLFEQTIKESEQYNRMLFDLSPIGLIVLNLDGSFSDINEAFSKIIENFREEIYRLNYWDLTSPENIAEEKLLFENLLNSKKYGPFRKEFIRENSTLVPTIVNSEMIELHNNQYILSSVEDISEQIKLSKEKESLEIQLRQQQKLEAIGTLASGVAHEINNPLMGIINYATLITKRIENDSLKTFAEGIVYEGERVAKIVKNLLSFAHQEKESAKFYDVYKIVENALSLLRAVLRKDFINLKTNIEENLPELKCKGNQVEQVLINLITNSRDALNLKYPKEDLNKKINLSICKIDTENDSYIKFIVEDFGNGISQENIHRIFDPFFTTKPRDKGTGLGLSISYGILKDHKSELEVETELGNFTRVSFKLKI